MKKIVINISDSTHEKLRFEAMKERKGIPELISERLLYKPFDIEVEEAFENWISEQVEKIIKE